MSTTTERRPLALVTGASSGIGRKLAKELARHGFDLVVAADDVPQLRDAARELEGLGATVDAVPVDLATDAGVDELWSRTEALGRPLAVAALNAGVGTGGAFATDTALADDLRVVDVNVRSTVHLAKHVTQAMERRGEGRILFTSSIASALPGTFQTVYNASKSFVQSFALALREELKGSGVTVTSLMPGPTDTDFFARAGMDDTKIATGDKDDPADVARDGYEALMRGDERVVSASLKTKLQAAGSRVLPDAAKARLQGRMSEPGSGEE